MSDIAFQRILRELKEVTSIQEMADTGISVQMDNDNLHSLVAEIRGPPNTPYENGVYKVKVEIPDSYPFHPPKVRFVTKIWHPNISSATGAVCLDVLSDQWVASMTLRTMLLSVQALLCSPEPGDPQDAVVARQFIESQTIFSETARFWAQYFAGANGDLSPSCLQKLNQLVEMGISKEEALTALSHCSWDVPRSVAHLFS